MDTVVVWRLDRLGRSLKHLVTLLDELHAVGVSFVSLGEGIDCTTPAGRLQLHVLAARAEFEKARIAERVAAGLARARECLEQHGPCSGPITPRPAAHWYRVAAALRRQAVSVMACHRHPMPRLGSTDRGQPHRLSGRT